MSSNFRTLGWERGGLRFGCCFSVASSLLWSIGCAPVITTVDPNDPRLQVTATLRLACSEALSDAEIRQTLVEIEILRQSGWTWTEQTVAAADGCIPYGSVCAECNQAAIDQLYGIEPTPCGSDADCNDGDGCTVDRCDEGSGLCLHSGCDDSNICNGAEFCFDGACSPGVSLDCDDFDPCTVDMCDATAGCVNTAVVCEVEEVCVDGVCFVPCDEDADCENGHSCNDGACDR